MSSSRILPDIVTDSRLETIITAEFTEHVSYTSGPSARLVRTRERWVRDGPKAFLGQGAYGTVYRERCGDNVRAVKEIRKFVQSGEEIDFTRELEAVMKFSHRKVSDSPYSCRGSRQLTMPSIPIVSCGRMAGLSSRTASSS